MNNKQNMPDTVKQVWSGITTIVERYNEIKDKIRELDKDYLIDLDNITVDLDDCSFTFSNDGINVDYYMSSFGENFDQHYLIPYEVLYLEDDEIEDYVNERKAEYYQHNEKARLAEIERLKKQLSKLEELR